MLLIQESVEEVAVITRFTDSGYFDETGLGGSGGRCNSLVRWHLSMYVIETCVECIIMSDPVAVQNMYVAAVISRFELIGLRREVARHEERDGCCLSFCATERTCWI